MPKVVVFYKHHSKNTFTGGAMSDIIECYFEWLSAIVQQGVYDAYNATSSPGLRKLDDVIVHFDEMSPWDRRVEDIAFEIFSGPNGLSHTAHQMFCDNFDNAVITCGVPGQFVSEPLNVTLRRLGVSYSIELCNCESHGFGRTPDGDAVYTF